VEVVGDVTRPPRLSRVQLVILDAGAAVGLTAVLLTFALARAHPVSNVPGWAVWLVEAGIGLPVGARRLCPVPAFLFALAASLIAAVLGLEYGYFAPAGRCESDAPVPGRKPNTWPNGL